MNNYDIIRYKLLQCVAPKNIIDPRATPITITNKDNIITAVESEFDLNFTLNKIILSNFVGSEVDNLAIVDNTNTITMLGIPIFEVVQNAKTDLKIQIYTPNIKHPYDIELNSQLISNFSKVYCNVCNKLGVSFNKELLSVNNSKKTNEFIEYYKYLEKYIYDSKNINRNLIQNAVACKPVNGNAKKLINVIDMYNKIYTQTNFDKPIDYKIYHVGRMMYDIRGFPCIKTPEHITLCFLSCSLTILDNWINNENINFPIIYEITVDSEQPIFYLFDNTEQHECLLKPGSILVYTSHELMVYLDKKCLVICMTIKND